MNLFIMKKWMLGLVLTLGSLITLPAYAWPDVDHMNMCGSATKVVKSGFTNWADYDRYIAQRGNAYYLRTNCPQVRASVLNPKSPKKASSKTTNKGMKIAKSSKSKAFKRKVKYDEKADCARVDRMNGYGSAVTVKRTAAKNYHSQARSVAKYAYSPRANVKRKYNYFKKR